MRGLKCEAHSFMARSRGVCFFAFLGEMGAMVHGVGLGAQEKEHQEVTLEVIGGDQSCKADGAAGSEAVTVLTEHRDVISLEIRDW
jgi:hypothetical protein